MRYSDKRDRATKGYLLIRYSEGYTEVESVPTFRNTNESEMLAYGHRLWEIHRNKYKWVKVYNRDMRLLEVIE